MYKDTSKEEIDECMNAAWEAFHHYRTLPLTHRQQFMNEIAHGLAAAEEDLVSTAMRETNLPHDRLLSELKRTILQLNQYGTACATGQGLEVRIDEADEKGGEDMRKMNIPLGPVVVFGASNFPFAYSTAGGDTACAFAAGCPVIVKAHLAHADTSEKVAKIISEAAIRSHLPQGIFSHIHGASFEVGKQLVQHEKTAAVGFTGSFEGGKQLFDWGNERAVPIPVFCEMGSVNPVFLLPDKLSNDHLDIAEQYAHSITQSVGQFCTNPGIIIGQAGTAMEKFITHLSEKLLEIAPAKMLHNGIAAAYDKKKGEALNQRDVDTVMQVNSLQEGSPALARTTGKTFLENSLLHQEIFGPFSLVVVCDTPEEMLAIAKGFAGQLTSTILATDADICMHGALLEAIKNICGRIIFNSVPTGVRVCTSMQHGGPFPATTDARFTAVGADGIKRFTRPQAYQNWPDHLLPPALQNGNPLGIWRMVNNQLTREGAAIRNY